MNRKKYDSINPLIIITANHSNSYNKSPNHLFKQVNELYDYLTHNFGIVLFPIKNTILLVIKYVIIVLSSL